MSNPSGTDHDEADAQAAAEGRDEGGSGFEQTFEDSDPVTEVIDIPSETGFGDPATGERRYTAPGFDAGSTQIIDRLPDPPTEFITTPTEAFGSAGARSRPAPQAIQPRRRRNRSLWQLTLILLIAGLLAAAIAGALAYKRSADRAANADQVRSAIETFDTAVREGDLATLRTVTCGQTRDAYVNYDEKTWADTYAKIAAAKQYPVVDGIEEVVVNGDHAEANVTSYLAFDPATKSTRSFDLQFRDDRWKICQSG